MLKWFFFQKVICRRLKSAKQTNGHHKDNNVFSFRKMHLKNNQHLPMVTAITIPISTNIIILWLVRRMRHLQCGLLAHAIVHGGCWWTAICSIPWLSIVLLIVIIVCIECIVCVWRVIFPTLIRYQLLNWKWERTK